MLVFLNAVPTVAIYPVLAFGLGAGGPAKLWFVALMCLFPVILATQAGTHRISPELAELSRSLGTGRWQDYLRFRLPAALPQIFVGLKVAMPLAVIGVVVGEMQYGESGLGTIIVQTSGQGDTATAFAAITLLAVLSILLYYVLVGIERLALPWVRATTSRR